MNSSSEASPKPKPLRLGPHGKRPATASLLLLTPFAIAFSIYLGAYLVMHPAATGDEPHYFIIAESIAHDGDIDLANNYASRSEVEAVCNCFPLEPHALRFKSSGGLYPQHGIGLPLLLVPAVALDGLTLVRLFMVLLSALLADQVYRLLVQLGVASSWRRWLAWAAIVFTLPLLVFSNQILTEVPGALLVVIAVRVIAAPRPTRAALAGGALAGAFLPWLQTRYLPLAGLICLGLLYRIAGSPVHPRTWLAELRRRVADVVVVVAAYAVSLGVLALMFWHLYGSISPDAPYRGAPGFGQIGSAGWKFWYTWFLTYVFDPGIGWIPYAPVAWLALAGLVCVYRRFGWRGIAVGLGLVVYALLVASTGIPAGTGFPARYIVTIIPLAVIPLALLVEQVRDTRLIFIPLFALSAVFAVAALIDYQSLYPFARERRHEPRLFGVRSIQTAFPSTLFIYVPMSSDDPPGAFTPQSGRLVGKRVLASSAHGDPPGLILWGPYARLRTGHYRAAFLVRVRGRRGTEVGRAEVVENGRLIAARPIIALPRLRAGLHRIVVPFSTGGGFPIETRIFFEGKGSIEAGTATINPVANTLQPLPPASFPGWPLAFVWIAGTALIATQFARRMGPSDATV